MDIARLGVALDPQPFVKGEKEVKQAMDRIKSGAKDANSAMESTGKKASSSFQQMAGAARTAASGIRSAFDGMANAVGIFSPKLGFALQALRGFAAMAGSTISSMRSLSTGAAAAGGGIRGLAAAMGTLAAVAGTVIGVMTGLLAVILPLVIAFKAISGAFTLFSDGLRGAAAFESLKVRFAGVLGSMEAAEVRMKDLAKLAADTPFELEGIANASLTLESLTAGAYSSTKALTAVGDAAAKSGQQIDTTAEQIGRIYAGLKTGVGFDDPLRTLTAKGVFAPEVYQQLMAMNKEGAKFQDMWKIITDQLDRAGGSMQNLSVTFEGRVSTMKDTWAEFKRTLGEAILPAATEVVKLMTEQIGKLNEYAKSIAPTIKEMANQAVAFVRVLGQEGGLESAMQAAGDKLEEALDGGFMKFVDTVNSWVKDKFGVDLKSAVNDLVNADVWGILENDIFPKLGAALLRALRNAVLGAFEGIGNLITGGAAGAVGNYLGNGIATQSNSSVGTSGSNGFTGGAGGLGGGLMPAADLPFSADDGVISSAEEAQKFMGDNQLLPDINGVVADGGAIGENTDALKDLSDSLLVYGPEQDMGRDQGPPSAENDFDWRMGNEMTAVEANQAADQASMKFKAPSAGGGSTFMPTKRAGRVGGGGKSESEKMMDEGKKITEDLRNPTEEMESTIANLEKLKAAGAISAETFTRGVAQAKEDYTKAVDGMTEKAKKGAEEQMTALQRLAAEWTNVAKQVDEMSVGIMNSISTNMTSAITGMIQGTMTAKEAFSKMAASIVNDILQMTTKMLVQYMLGQAMGWFTGGIGGGAGGAVAGIAHDGGVAGFQTETRSVSPGVFRGAQRYHSGGTVGLAPGEVPIIAERGETITTEDQEKMKARLRGEKKEKTSQVAVTNVNVVDARMIDEHIVKNPDAVMNVLSRNKARVKQVLNIQG